MGGASDAAYAYLYKGDASTIGISLNAGGDTYFNGGAVGIGTSSPAQMLDVVGHITTNGTVYAGSSAANTARISMGSSLIEGYYTESAPRFRLGRDTFGGGDVGLELWGDAGIWRDYPAGDLKLRTNSIDRMTILLNGDVGIGTTAPDGILHIAAVTPTVIIESLPNSAAKLLL